MYNSCFCKIISCCKILVPILIEIVIINSKYSNSTIRYSVILFEIGNERWSAYLLKFFSNRSGKINRLFIDMFNCYNVPFVDTNSCVGPFWTQFCHCFGYASACWCLENTMATDLNLQINSHINNNYKRIFYFKIKRTIKSHYFQYINNNKKLILRLYFKIKRTTGLFCPIISLFRKGVM